MSNTISYDLDDYKEGVFAILGDKSSYTRKDLIKFIKTKYSASYFGTDFEEFLKCQNMNIGDFGINNVEEYTDGEISNLNVLYLIFKDKSNFTKVTYKDDEFFMECIISFDDNDNIVNYYINGDYMDLQNEIDLFVERRSNAR